MLVRRDLNLVPWLLVVLVLVIAGVVGALLAVRANSRDETARTAPALTVAAAPKQTTTAAAVSFAPAATAVTVPDVRGQTVSEARKTISAKGLVAEEQQVPSMLPKKTVVAQVPAPGTTMQRGDHVVVSVSLGPKKHTGSLGHSLKPHRDRPGQGHGRGNGHNQ